MRNGSREITALSALAVSCFTGAALAAPIAVSNPGFDTFKQDGSGLIDTYRFVDGSDGLSENEIVYSALDGQPTGALAAFFPAGGWQPTGARVFQRMGTYRGDAGFTTPTGTMAFVSTGVSDEPATTSRGFTQSVGTPVAPNSVYTLTVDISDYDSTNHPGLTSDIIGLSPNIEVDLLAGTTVLPGSFSFTRPSNGGTSTFTRTVTTDSTVPLDDLTIRLSASGSSGMAGTQTFFDNVTLDVTPVPEPAALSLLGLAALGLGRRRRA